jgi:predicted Fe-S protein YdhL (DUF1289 family)
MTDAPAGAVPSPCTGICTLGGDGLCRGCFRHIDEIAAWPSADLAERRAIITRAAARRRSGTDDTT